MNCRDINHLLDISTPEDLRRTQGDAVDRHLASCHACREEWANWREMAALPVPATPAALRGRIAAVLPARNLTPARRSLRPFVVGGVLMAGAVLAATVAWQVARREPEIAAPLADASLGAAVAEQGGAEAAASLAPVGADLPPDSAMPAAARTGASGALDPFGIVVLKRPEAAADAQAIVLAEQCHDAIVSQLRAVVGLKLITGAAASPEADHPYPLSRSDQEIGRAHDVGNVLTVSTENGCRGTLYNTQTGMPVAGLMYGQRLPPDDGWNSFARSMVQSIRDKVLMDPATRSAEARATLLNTALDDGERAKALGDLSSDSHRLGKDAVRSAFDNDMVAAAVHLGTKSSNANIRGSAWASLREVDDPQLIQPLLQSLANDPDKTVRLQAAFTLHAFVDSPGVREALLRAAAEDPDSEPTAACCIETVREAAERALVANAEFRGWVRRKLLDESLPARSRLFALAPFTMDGRFVERVADIGGDAAGVVFDIGRREQDPRVRRMAWDVLDRADPDKEFVPVLLGDLRSHPDEYARAAAAKVLTRHVDDPDVREALNRALQDPSMEVRRAATSVSGGVRTP